MLEHSIELTAGEPDPAERLCLLDASQRRFGRYELLCRFAMGGMANLFLARFAGPGGFRKIVAIKRIHEHLTQHPDFVKMFLDEARLAARIEHPNVVQVIELGSFDSQYFIVMEYVPGESLTSLLTRAELPWPLCARIVSQAALGLHAAHELRDSSGNMLEVVHRDVSPANILVSYQGVVKVTDFGVARAAGNLHVTDVGVVKGKSAYMSPEQAKGEPVDRRADIFSLGIVLHEATTRRPLFRTDSDILTMAKVLHEAIPAPSKVVREYPPELEAIVMKALNRDCAERFQTAQELHEALENYIGACAVPILQSSIGDVMQSAFVDNIAARDNFLKRCEQEVSVINPGGNGAGIEAITGPGIPVVSGARSSDSGLGPDDNTSGMEIIAGNPWPKRIALTAIILAGLGFGTLWAIQRFSANTNDSQPQKTRNAKIDNAEAGVSPQSPKKIRVVINVSPQSAEIVFDGQPVSNPYEYVTVAEQKTVAVSAAADGYISRQFDVSLAEDGRWMIALNRKAEPATERTDKVPRRKPRRGPKPGRRSSTKKPATKKPKKGVNTLFDNPYAQ